MKKFLMLPAIAATIALLFSSCSKTDNGGYMCTCTYTVNGTSNTIVYDMHSQTKAYATSDCAYDQAYLQAKRGAPDASCHL